MAKARKLHPHDALILKWILDTVRKSPGIRVSELESKARLRRNTHNEKNRYPVFTVGAFGEQRERSEYVDGYVYFALDGHFRARIGRLVDKGLLVRVTMNRSLTYYYLPEQLPPNFDYSDPTARLVAADYAQEHGLDELAGRLRACKKVDFHPPK